LLAVVPYRQMIVTSAHHLPDSPRITQWLRVSAGQVTPSSADQQ
jgi:hypothetical protein